MAGKLVESLHREFDPDDYEDTYREAVLDLIERKAKGEDLTPEEPEPEEEPADLTAALAGEPGVLTMPRTLWNGSLSFGLVNVPVQPHERRPRPRPALPPAAQEGQRADRAAPLLLQGGRGGRLGGGRARVRARQRQAGRADRPRAGHRPAAQDAHDRHRGLRRHRGGRPDLLRPPLVPAAVRRERGHAARLPAAREGDGVDRPRRARAVRDAHQGVPRARAPARRPAVADHAAASTTRCAPPTESRPAGASPPRRRSTRPWR